MLTSLLLLYHYNACSTHVELKSLLKSFIVLFDCISNYNQDYIAYITNASHNSYLHNWKFQVQRL